jgi:SHS2 domain-containing protein
MYEFFDHTADVGIRLAASDLETLLADAGRALYALIVDNADDIRPDQRFEFRVAGLQPDYLLFDWLSALLRHFESTRVVLSRFDVRLNADGLTAEVWGEPLDEDRHRLGNEVKAVTYHQLVVQQSDGEWRAEVIVDI